jgi:tRNA-specific 2-thiouridylase
MHWIAGAAPPPEVLARLGAKTRYRMPDARCTLAEHGAGGWRASFAAPQWAPTPGQYLVLYDGEVCLGGGVIVEEGGTTATGRGAEARAAAPSV